jgi:chromosome segregation protein
MHLKEVRMENFKSFGRKLSVPFEPGFTAVTGPNGSGKSNIGDAILFVLGPNSPRAIRAGRLTDLIFNGGEHGKGASHTQVSLVFDNSDRTMPMDADEVILTRKVRRNATKQDPDGYYSYFYVNGRASQKKEFVDLLNHARISADGYNITQQGDVLNICRMSNVERRKILDNIAGVTAFDNDIDQASNRRKEVEENLDRIGIVLEEIERSLAQLEKEKEAAARYQELQGQIQRTKGLMAWRRKSDYEAQIAQVQQQIENFTAERTKLEGQLAELREKQTDAQARFAEVEAHIREEGGEEVQRLQDELEKARDRMVRLEERINYCKSELSTGKEDLLPVHEELRRVKKELERTAKQQEQCSTDHEAATTALKERRDELTAMQERISQSDKGAMQITRELSQLKQEHEAKQLKLHEAKLETDRLQQRLHDMEAASKTAQTDRAAMQSDLDETAWQAKELREAAGGTGKKRKELERRHFELKKAMAEYAKQNEDLENRIRRLQRELAELQARQDAAAKVQGGMTRSVQEILSARDQGTVRGIIGTVSELATVDDKYRVALETAAGQTLQAIVVEDDAVAAQCIEILKQSRAGRAKFLPLNKMVPGRPRGTALMKMKQDGCLGFALDLIEFNPRYQNAFWHALGDTLVVDTMNTGRRLMGGVRMVTLDGELFEATGAMVGGASGKKGDGPGFTNTDRGRLDAALQELQEAERGQETVLERLGQLRTEVVALEDELSAEGRQDSTAEERLKELEKRETLLRSKLASFDEEQKRVAKEQEDASDALTKAKELCASLTERLETLEKERDAKGAALLKGSKKEWRERVEALEKEIRELHEAALTAESRRDVAAKQLELVQARAQELEEKIRGEGDAKSRLEADLAETQKAYQKAKGEVDALMQMERKATGALKGLQGKRDQLYEELTDLKARIDKLADRMETHYGLITNAKAKLPALEEALGEAMVELKEHPIEVGPEEDVPAQDELRRTLRNQEAALDRLGPVNMRALEEYNAQSERRSNLKGEVERLQSQRKELIELVEEITKKKKGALLEVFDAISGNFSEVYGRLSLGGKAVMELENPDDPFAGGLVLKAQPLGKRVLRLDALSGGEKSLTSMAFIFALQMYDPSPFYYLDEVDQNLDAVNSELLAKLVRENSKYAQFIVVSLRKVTLKEAAHIYGVTQQTLGQSEIIANFDINQLPDAPEKNGADSSRDDGSRNDGDDDDEDDDNMVSDDGQETGLQETIKGMVQVKVEA